MVLRDHSEVLRDHSMVLGDYSVVLRDHSTVPRDDRTAGPCGRDRILTDVTDPAKPHRMWALYLGGFLGPFGGGITATMLPEMASGLHTSVPSAGLTITAYMVPFALVMLVSGTLAERWGRVWTLRIAYAGYIAASLAVAVGPTLGLVLMARGLQGAANAFTTPVLIAVLADLVPFARLGRTLGTYGAFQAAGQAFAPFVGGVSAQIGWRWGFVASAVMAAVLLAATPVPQGRARAARTASPASVLRPGVLVGAGAAAFAYLTSMGMTVLAALVATDAFGAGPSLRGLVVAAYGVAGLLAGPVVGRLLDRAGIRVMGAVLGCGMAIGAVVCGFSPALPVLVAGLLVGGATNTGVRATTTMLAVHTSPENRGGATSFVLAFQFIGAAVAPALWLPLYHLHGAPIVALAGIGAVVAAGLLAVAPLSRSARPPAGVT